METTVYQTEHSFNTASIAIPENPFASSASPKLQISKEGREFAKFFKNSLPSTQEVTDIDMLDWARTYDRLVRIDKKSRYEIYAVTTWALLHDGFLNKQGSSLSASILRKKTLPREINISQGKEGITYYDVFLQGYIRNPGETIEILHKYFANEGMAN